MHVSTLLLIAIISASMTLYDFNKKSNPNDWFILDDVVMGGQSSGHFNINEEGYGVFHGKVSLENNGGFSSVRHQFKSQTIKNYSRFVIHLKGDGKTYQFRAKNSVNDSASYVYKFDTTSEWTTIEIPFSEMYPSYRGRKLARPNFEGAILSEIAFLIGNKKPQNFNLLIDWIKLE